MKSIVPCRNAASQKNDLKFEAEAVGPDVVIRVDPETARDLAAVWSRGHATLDVPLLERANWRTDMIAILVAAAAAGRLVP